VAAGSPFGLEASVTAAQDLVRTRGLRRRDRVVTAKLLAALEEPESGTEAIRRFFRLKVALSVEPGRPRGCLVTNSATELASRD